MCQPLLLLAADLLLLLGGVVVAFVVGYNRTKARVVLRYFYQFRTVYAILVLKSGTLVLVKFKTKILTNSSNFARVVYAKLLFPFYCFRCLLLTEK